MAKTETNNLPELMTPKALAEYLGVAEQTLANWRSQGGGPTYTKIGGRIRYQKGDVQAWLKTRKKRYATESPMS